MAEDPRQGTYTVVEPPIGVLGYRLGSLITIEGVRSSGMKTGNQTLLVDTIDGAKLKAPVAIWINHQPGLPLAERVVLRGFETGEWIGTPTEFGAAYPERGMTQAGWQFFHSFVIAEVISPKTLQDDDPTRPTL